MINETLVAAAQYMDEHGKAVGQYEAPDGSVCMMGAIRKVVYRSEAFLATRHLRMFVEQKFGPIKFDIGYVNDYKLHTKEETVKFMMEAAEWEPSKSE